jgi:BirA family biotin operon repressor/biotin-[acetyl-CoA-carboxylase] ligase
VSAADLDPSKFRSALRALRLGRNFEYVPSCSSTNDEVATRALAGAEEGVLVVAGEQTAGRGRRGRVWQSPADQDLTFSMLLRPALPARLVAPMTLLAGAALAAALAGLGFAPRLKWPNDVLLDTAAGPRKVAGILTEMASEGGQVRHVILGVGINVNTETFPGELAARATSLCLAHGQKVDRCAVLAAFVNAFEPIYDDFVAHGPSAALAKWNEHALLGQLCSVERNGQPIQGVAEAVDETGSLLLRTASGETIAVHAGEINWLSPPKSRE